MKKIGENIDHYPVSKETTIPSATPSMISPLPSNFASEVLVLEEELSLSCKIDTVQRLLELFSSAVEYYEALNNPKFLHYQQRIQSLLARSDVLQLLKVKKSGIVKNKNNQADLSAQRMLQSHHSASNSASKRIQDNILSQCSTLNSRILQRNNSYRTENTSRAKLTESMENIFARINKKRHFCSEI